MRATRASRTLRAKRLDPEYSILGPSKTLYDYIPIESMAYIEVLTGCNIESNVERYTQKLLREARTCIKQVGEQVGLSHIFGDISIDVLKTQYPNAIVLHFEEDQSYAIGFDPSLFNMIEHILMTCMRIVSATNEDSIQDIYEATSLYLEVVFAHVNMSIYEAHVENLEEVLGKMLLLTRDSASEHRQNLNWVLRLMALYFIITHELAHVACGHFQDCRPQTCHSVHTGGALFSTFAHEQEYQADEWSYNVLMSLEQDGRIKSYMSQSFQLLFSILALLEKLYQPKTLVGQHFVSRHPKATERLLRLKDLSAAFILDGSTDYGVNIIERAILLNLKTAYSI